MEPLFSRGALVEFPAQQPDHHEHRYLHIESNAAQVVNAGKQAGVLDHDNAGCAADPHAGRHRHRFVLGAEGDDFEIVHVIERGQQRLLVRVRDGDDVFDAAATQLLHQGVGGNGLSGQNHRLASPIGDLGPTQSIACVAMT